MKRSLAFLVLLVFPGAGGLAQEKLPAALTEMVNSERAFAALGAEKGVRESFWEYFGEEGISFTPHPVKFREDARKNPPPNPAPPRQWKLEWWPVYGDVAESGDLGYNTGPTLVSDLAPPHAPRGHGFFFSVWKKQPDGTWRVAADMGSDTPGPAPEHQDRTRYTRAPQEKYKNVASRDAAAGRAEMLRMEAEFFRAAQQRGARESYLSYIADSARLHRPKHFPILGRDAARKYLEEKPVTVVQWEGIDGGVSASGELGYDYGRYEVKDAAGAPEKGYYTRVWKRNAKGDWKLVAEVLSPLPAAAN